MWSTTITLFRDLKYCPIKEFLKKKKVNLVEEFRVCVFGVSCSLYSWYKRLVREAHHILKKKRNKAGISTEDENTGRKGIG